MTTKSPKSAWTPVPILMYHAVENEPRAPKYKHFYVTRSEFAWQMRALKRSGYTPITFNQLAEAMAGTSALPYRPVLLTFDDGYENLIDNVYPLMKELDWPYTVFLVSERIGRTNEWVVPEGYEATPLLSWDQIKAMAVDSKVDYQPHTATHPKLDQIDAASLRRELRDCRDSLAQNLQHEMNVLCYPYGNHNDAVVDAAREAGYTMAVTTNFGRVRRGDDPLRLPRISVYHVPPVSLTYGIGTLNFDWRLRTRKDTRPEPVSAA
jgi:peptidoglycan/xylan/chitin deacetylase (PgdA/CDA1 family)